MRYAYADPPYIGQAKKHYKCAEIDHAALIERLRQYDGWALSCSSPSLRTLLPLCPEDIRVMPWVKPFCAFKVNVNPAYAWEPLLVKVGPRKRTRSEPTVRDWFSHVIMLKKGLVGAKPPKLCRWLFDVMGMTPEDEFDDLFPGTGIVTKTWEEWKKELALLARA